MTARHYVRIFATKATGRLSDIPRHQQPERVLEGAKCTLAMTGLGRVEPAALSATRICLPENNAFDFRALSYRNEKEGEFSKSHLVWLPA